MLRWTFQNPRDKWNREIHEDSDEDNCSRTCILCGRGITSIDQICQNQCHQ